jgi:hypothetical protein
VQLLILLSAQRPHTELLMKLLLYKKNQADAAVESFCHGSSKSERSFATLIQKRLALYNTVPLSVIFKKQLIHQPTYALNKIHFEASISLLHVSALGCHHQGVIQNKGVRGQQHLVIVSCSSSVQCWTGCYWPCNLLFWITPWWWHSGVETCRSFRLASSCILLSA